jgi:hypothetical protein
MVSIIFEESDKVQLALFSKTWSLIKF